MSVSKLHERLEKRAERIFACDLVLGLLVMVFLVCRLIATELYSDIVWYLGSPVQFWILIGVLLIIGCSVSYRLHPWLFVTQGIRCAFIRCFGSPPEKISDKEVVERLGEMAREIQRLYAEKKPDEAWKAKDRFYVAVDAAREYGKVSPERRGYKEFLTS